MEHNSINPFSLFQDEPVLLRLLCNHYLMETNEKASVFVFFWHISIFLLWFPSIADCSVLLFFRNMPLVWISSLTPLI